MAGDTDHYAATCTPDQCELNEYGQLPNRDLWDWFRELAQWSDSGAQAATDEAVKAMSVTVVRAFVAFRDEMDAAMTEAQQRREKMEAIRR